MAEEVNLVDVINSKTIDAEPVQILVDLSSLFFRITYSSIEFLKLSGFQDWAPIQKGMIEEILNFKKQFPRSEVIICADKMRDGKYWRHSILPCYKDNRKDKVEVIPKEVLRKQKDEIYRLFENDIPWKFYQIEGLEADDIIAVLSKKKLTIIYGVDKDLSMLLSENCYMYNPLVYSRGWVTQNSEEVRFKHILRGDSSDGVPNVFSDADTLVTEGKRQKACGDKKLNELWLYNKEHGFEMFFNEFIKDVCAQRYEQNRKVIDLINLPPPIVSKIESFIPHTEKNDINSLLIYLDMINMKEYF